MQSYVHFQDLENRQQEYYKTGTSIQITQKLVYKVLGVTYFRRGYFL